MADADAWLALGGALDDAAWGPALEDGDVQRRARRRRGGSSWTSSAA